MSGWTEIHQSIKDELVGQTARRVLIIEGTEDEAFVTALLDQLAPSQWESKWTIGVAGKKAHVLKILAKEPSWIGLVDRDEWTDHAVAQATTQHSNLKVLPRFCMENYFIEPDEIWAALPANKQAELGTKEAELKNALASKRSEWLRHGVLWHTVNPLWEGLRSLGFKEKLLELEAAQDDAAIKATLSEWHDHLEPNQIIEQFQTYLTEALTTSPEDQYRKWIHGKRYFREQIVPSLNKYLDSRNANEWLKDLRRTMPLPADMSFLWQDLGL